MLRKYVKYILPVLFIITAMLLSVGCEQPTALELSGTIESTQIDAGSEVAGKIIKIEKVEGDQVKKGDVIAVIDSSMQELVVKQQEAVVKLKEARLDEIKAGTRPEQLEQAKSAARSADLAAKNAQTAVDTAKTTYDYWVEKYNNVKSLYDSNTAAESELLDTKYKVDTAKQQLDVAQKQLKSAQAQLQSANSQVSLLEKGATSQSIKAAEADLEQSTIMLEQAKLVLSKYQVKAPVDGTFILNNVDIGDMVNTGTSTGTISDLNNLWIRIYIQQKDLKLISLNRELDLRAQSLNGKTIKGKIVYIADKAEFTPKNTETSDSKENTVFQVKIKILERVNELKPGMTVDAIIPLGE
jgi:HlyD family secretion protein